MSDVIGETATSLLPLSTANKDAQQDVTNAIISYVRLRGNPVALLNASLEKDPKLYFSSAVIAFLYSIGGANPASNPVLAKALCHVGEANIGDVSDREWNLMKSVEAFCKNYLSESSRYLELVLDKYPTDILALKMLTDMYYLSGQNNSIRMCVEKVLNDWEKRKEKYKMEYGLVLGMYSFGLEESFDYSRALSIALASTGINPDDSWAVHAAAHVYEMRGEFNRGLEYLDSTLKHWETANLFTTHMWWHYCLFLMQTNREDRYERTVEIFEKEIFGRDGTLCLVDAASLLWRLELSGYKVKNEYWLKVFELWKPHVYDRAFVFNDIHLLFAALGSGTVEGTQTAKLLGDMQEELTRRAAMHSSVPKTTYESTVHIGITLTKALCAYSAGDYMQCVSLLQPIYLKLQPIGGSHAQRDVIPQTLFTAIQKLHQRLCSDREAYRNSGRL